VDRACIKHISYYLPEETLTNKQLAEQFPFLNEEDILKKTGIAKRHKSAVDEIASDMAYKAALKLFEESRVEKDEIDLIIFCSEALDNRAPSSACFIHGWLNMPGKCGAFDIALGCSGFVYGLMIAKGFIESGQAKKILLLNADLPTKIIHPEDHELLSLFSDAGTATLIDANQQGGVLNCEYGSDGKGADKLIVHGGLRKPIDEAWLAKYKDVGGLKLGRMEMDSLAIFTFSIKEVPGLIERVLEKNKMTLNDIDLFIFHQANGFMLELLRRKMKIDKEKFFIFMEETGNTVSCTIPIALKQAMDYNQVKKGSKVLLAGFGIGFSWAATIIEF
jgi:3-oxoacyl-[acyl-carrier-protein] synthase-3